MPAVIEENMPTHLAGQWRTGFLQFSLDQRMAGLPHQRATAVLADQFRKLTAAFHIENDVRPRAAIKQVTGKQHHQAICPDDLRSEEHTSELQSRENLVCRLL